jgi:hypothetical protein
VTASYDPTLSTPLDEVRFTLGDTIVTPPESALLSDEELTALLIANGDHVGRTALAAAKSLVARFSRLVTMSVGDSSASFGELVTQYRDLVSDLQRSLARGGGALPYAGGISHTDKRSREVDHDRTEPTFARSGVGVMDERCDRERRGVTG